MARHEARIELTQTCPDSKTKRAAGKPAARFFLAANG
jgi:hypothetical protein